MNIICSPVGIVDPLRPNGGMLHLNNAGFSEILLDMGMYCSTWELETYGTLEYKKRTFDKLPKGIWNVIKAPFLSFYTKRTDMNDILGDIVKKSIGYGLSHGIKCIIVQPLFAGINREDLWDVNKQYFLDLYTSAKAYLNEKQDMTANSGSLSDPASSDGRTIHILLQNLCKEVNGHMIRGICSDASVACQWIDELNHLVGEEVFGMCVDTGALNLCGQDMYSYLHTLGNRVKAVILRENDGHHNSSMLPFTSVAYGQSQMDWLGMIRALRQIEFDGYLIMELADTLCAFSPLLRPQVLKLAKSVADYFQWQIEIEKLLKKHSSIVLFGAGNMCRNYMKCYGKTYPPLFTCDNNPKLWGTMFEGLEVKAPTALKELPKDCSIFICNVYYDEIKQQLLDMGIENEIAFFNDEYMPTFYFDRIER